MSNSKPEATVTSARAMMGQMQTIPKISNPTAMEQTESFTSHTSGFCRAANLEEYSSQNSNHLSAGSCQKQPLAYEKSRRSGRVTKRSRRRGSKKLDCHNGSWIQDSDGSESECDEHSANRQRDEATTTFACHFYKWQPTQHIKCMTLKLTRIRDIRQHILRQHTRPYCPSCYEKFSSRTLCNKHISDRLCKQRPPSEADKLDIALQRLGDHRADRTMSKDEQWMEIWTGLFPNTPHPKSPYLGSMLEETGNLIHNHWEKDRSRLLPAFRNQENQDSAESFGDLLIFVFKDFRNYTEQETPILSREPSPLHEPDSSETHFHLQGFMSPSTLEDSNSTGSQLLPSCASSVGSTSYTTNSSPPPQWAEPFDWNMNGCFGSSTLQSEYSMEEPGSALHSLNLDPFTQPHLFSLASEPLDAQLLIDAEKFGELELQTPYPQIMELSESQDQSI